VQTNSLAGRVFEEIYRVSPRSSDLHGFLVSAVEASGGRVLHVSDVGRAPVYLGVQLSSDERIGMLVYPFRVTRSKTRNRPADEIRGQLRYGSEASWERDHPVSRDIAGVDVTLIVGIDIEDEIILGLDATLWDPLPMGISFYAKYAEIESARRTGWHVWEKVNRPGNRRPEARSSSNLETVVAFAPDRLIDYARLERRATALRLEPPLRFSVATSMARPAAVNDAPGMHVLEEQFALSSQEILDIIGGRYRLAVAVRGGVAEHHLEQQLNDHPGVAWVKRLDEDSMHDFDITLVSGAHMRVECKNASPRRTADGKFKVEVQKTRASKGDPASRYYATNAFDAVAACLFSATGVWQFRFGSTAAMKRHKTYPDRLAPVQSITDAWVTDVSTLMP
jgi:hypothetical protein